MAARAGAAATAGAARAAANHRHEHFFRLGRLSSRGRIGIAGQGLLVCPPGVPIRGRGIRRGAGTDSNYRIAPFMPQLKKQIRHLKGALRGKEEF